MFIKYVFLPSMLNIFFSEYLSQLRPQQLKQHKPRNCGGIIACVMVKIVRFCLAMGSIHGKRLETDFVSEQMFERPVAYNHVDAHHRGPYIVYQEKLTRGP